MLRKKLFEPDIFNFYIYKFINNFDTETDNVTIYFAALIHFKYLILQSKK